jgi:hypothetical protein
MNFRMAQRILGLMLMVFSLTMLPPIAVSFIYADGHWEPFLVSSVIIASAGLLLWLPARNTRRDLRLRDGFLIVAVFWVFLGLAGATPLYLSDVPDLSFTDSVFEAVSGFTTTGTTVIVGLDELPKSILYYRQQIQWFGGMGIIVLAVAILPILGIGGMSLYKAETPGPMKHHANGESTLDDLPVADHRLRGRLLVRRHGSLRCGRTCVQHRIHCRLLPLRRGPRTFQQRRRRSGRNRIHVPRRRKLRTALRRPEAP